MKKIICSVIICFLALLLFSGCQKKQEDIDGGGSLMVPGREGDALGESLLASSEFPMIDDSPYVADSPMYRGTVIELEEEGGHLLLKLESAEGADFGYSNILMQMSEDTRATFRPDDLRVGDHLEVYFSDRNDGLPPVILSANKLPPAADTIYNGKIVRYEKDGEAGRLELESFTGNNVAVFHLSGDTQLYINEGELAPGAQVHVYHSGILTRSIPPQGQALEVRPYHESAQG